MFVEVGKPTRNAYANAKAAGLPTDPEDAPGRVTLSTSFQELLRRCENEDSVSSVPTRTEGEPGADAHSGVAAVRDGGRGSAVWTVLSWVELE